MDRLNVYMGPYHRSLLTENLTQKSWVEAEQQQAGEKSPKPSMTTPLAQTSKSIRVHHLHAAPNHGSVARLPPISSLCDAPAPTTSNNGAAAGRPIAHPQRYYHAVQQQLQPQPPHHQFSYRNHYQQHQPPPLVPHLSTGTISSSPLSPSTPVHSQYSVYHRDGRPPALAMPSLASPTVSLSSPSASPVGNATYKRALDEPALYGADAKMPARKRSRHAWPANMTRQIINVLLDEFLTDSAFRTTIYRSREERDHRFEPSGRSILEEYNKVQNMRRRYFIPLSYLLQWDKLRNLEESTDGTMHVRQRTNLEKKLAKPLERSRLQMIFCSAMKKNGDMIPQYEDDEEEAVDEAVNGKPVFELDIFVSELKRRDVQLWSRGVDAFHAWVSRKCSIDFIINH
ncbi:hypothetical protein IW140_002106 [Coemansia sp. RSA 1813]|nr:hypothetical protein EV178_001254 [Coemansia sp. RSA 1646]KAJ1772607.1 hypothetical protein LPJ74_001323 [Coemansia sp. RSA 1843]KAJ2091463.1 hypothetical protein IW138_001922 [Coemansia sp. RSA 986]KAJ2213874.1 hypothetical protein EV179_003458 [Coemansia sp. RSA 487]KAJ2570680.1 hypothetical protein IW140_002106 [Coemansia sp. RSA 1813]